MARKFLFTTIKFSRMLATDERFGGRESETGALLMSYDYHCAIKMNSIFVIGKEGVAKNLARATSLPAELNRYSKNCKLLCNILRDTKIIINEINTADYLTQGVYLHVFS